MSVYSAALSQCVCHREVVIVCVVCGHIVRRRSMGGGDHVQREVVIVCGERVVTRQR